MDIESYRLTHHEQLEAESIHIIREVAAEFQNPVMMYSIGKDSSVMLRLAQKAFAPCKIPFPFLHVDTRWKFHEMIEFRDRTAKELGLDLKDTTLDMLAFGLFFDYYRKGSKYRFERLALPSNLLLDRETLAAQVPALFYENYLSPVWNKLLRRSILACFEIRFDPNLFLLEDS